MQQFFMVTGHFALQPFANLVRHHLAGLILAFCVWLLLSSTVAESAARLHLLYLNWCLVRCDSNTKGKRNYFIFICMIGKSMIAAQEERETIIFIFVFGKELIAAHKEREIVYLI
jgi:hypothetical protein